MDLRAHRLSQEARIVIKEGVRSSSIRLGMPDHVPVEVWWELRAVFGHFPRP
jgi:hypothetical protein